MAQGDFAGMGNGVSKRRGQAGLWNEEEIILRLQDLKQAKLKKI